jgi:ribose 5-phosphate isomerase B
MTDKIVIGSDHAGFEYKQKMIIFLESKGITVKDVGTHSLDSVDYPDFAHLVAKAIENQEFEYGILLCGSGNGVAITANHHAGIRAGLAWNKEVARLIRQHNDANVLCLPARFISQDEAEECIDIFLTTAFEGGRHANRVQKITMC